MTEIYERIFGTDAEHHMIEHLMRDYCLRKGINLLWYRKIKNSNNPKWREIKLQGDQDALSRFLKNFENEINP